MASGWFLHQSTTAGTAFSGTWIKQEMTTMPLQQSRSYTPFLAFSRRPSFYCMHWTTYESVIWALVLLFIHRSSNNDLLVLSTIVSLFATRKNALLETLVDGGKKELQYQGSTSSMHILFIIIVVTNQGASSEWGIRSLMVGLLCNCSQDPWW